MFGTVNLDMRSIWLNYEVSLFVYSELFGEQLRAFQQTYLDGSLHLDAQPWAIRPINQRLLENTFRIFGPIL